MLKKNLSLQNAKELSNEKQSKINGGIMIYCDRDSDCPPNLACYGGFCCPDHY
jgi:hypothetical protein